MTPQTSAAIIHQLANALLNLRWSRLDHHRLIELLQTQPHDDCWLRQLHRCATHQPNLLTEAGRAQLARLINRDFQLRDRWPSRDVQTTEQWLGCRLFLGEAKNFSLASSSSLHAIVSSQLGRDSSRVTHWPNLLDWAIRKTNSDNAAVLVVAGTTLFESTVQFARAAGVPIVQLLLPNQATSTIAERCKDWLADALNRCLNWTAAEAHSAIGWVWLSPEIALANHSSPVAWKEQFPIQDRVAIALADHVLAIWLRAGGKIAGLLERRLSDPDFPTASVLVAIPQFTSTPVQDSSSASAWLERGAVGYVVIIDDSLRLASCGRCRMPQPATVQICCSMRQWLDHAFSRWRFLTHCTRGNSGPVPQESTAGYYRRIWSAGRVAPADPYLALQQILHEGRIRGSTWLTRGNRPMVSLSQVPLPELLSRRKFRGHLGRWDWEPYGLLLDQRVVAQARAVIYADQAEFDKLSSFDQPYFQPLDTNVDWSVEREWRVAGDIDLRALPIESVTVFTRFRGEAEQLAAHSPFPVMWVEE